MKEWQSVWVCVAEHMSAPMCVCVCVCLIVSMYGGRLAEVDSLCLQSGFVVSRSLAIEAMAA